MNSKVTIPIPSIVPLPLTIEPSKPDASNPGKPVPQQKNTQNGQTGRNRFMRAFLGLQEHGHKGFGKKAITDENSKARVERIKLSGPTKVGIASTIYSATQGLDPIRDETRRKALIADIKDGKISAAEVKGNHPLRKMTTGLQGLSDTLPRVNGGADFISNNSMFANFVETARNLLNSEIGEHKNADASPTTLQSLGNPSGHAIPFSVDEKATIENRLNEVADLVEKLQAELKNHPDLAYAYAETDSKRLPDDKLEALGDKKGWDAIKDVGKHGSPKQLREELGRQTKKFFTKDQMTKKFGRIREKFSPQSAPPVPPKDPDRSGLVINNEQNTMENFFSEDISQMNLADFASFIEKEAKKVKELEGEKMSGKPAIPE